MKVIGGAFYQLAGHSIDLREYRDEHGPVFIVNMLGRKSPKLRSRHEASNWAQAQLSQHHFVNQPEQLKLF